MSASSEGPPALLVIFKKMFGSFANSSICKQNDFSNLQSYFLQKEIPIAMAGLRNSHNICPPEVLKFLLDLFKYNDNSPNKFSDNYYRAAMVEALGETVTPVVSVLQVRKTRLLKNLIIFAFNLHMNGILFIIELIQANIANRKAGIQIFFPSKRTLTI